MRILRYTRKLTWLTGKIYQLLKRKISLDFYLKNQFGKASLSMMLNLAEGSSKVGTRDRRNFIVIARGSTFECDH